MRYSVREDDAGHHAWQKLRDDGLGPAVFLDGVEVKEVATADDEIGYVLRYVLNSDGLPQIDPSDRSKAWTEEVFGRVRFELRKLP